MRTALGEQFGRRRADAAGRSGHQSHAPGQINRTHANVLRVVVCVVACILKRRCRPAIPARLEALLMAVLREPSGRAAMNDASPGVT
ncbi:hypothetical protein ACIQB5_28100 [Streptomyces sp. NPDC088560]|uniref:hypothetical protein n=1 Tax=Streptomyces sp. NPDC088560 TaxID=3365868 RepID=UPI00382C3E34